MIVLFNCEIVKVEDYLYRIIVLNFYRVCESATLNKDGEGVGRWMGTSIDTMIDGGFEMMDNRRR